MRIRVLSFGVLLEMLGANSATIELAEASTVAELLVELRRSHPAIELRGIAVSVNSEYAHASQVLRENDEVGLLPPVSGGTALPAGHVEESTDRPDVVIALTRERIDAEKLVTSAKQGEDGAVTVFDGIVRNNSRGRQTLYLDYEAYEEMATKQMEELAHEARGKFGVRHVTIVHRLGRLGVGETSVLIVVASAHRAEAFDACRWLIDTLKKTVPIWKKESFVDGAMWAAGEPFPSGLSVEATDGDAE